MPTQTSPSTTRVHYDCTQCGQITDAFVNTNREERRLCRTCLGKRADTRPKELNDLSGAEWAQASKSVQEFPDTRSPKQRFHGAAFHKSLAKEQISKYTQRGQTVLDPFLGVGTTLDAAWELGRNGVGIELNSEFHALAQADLEGLDTQKVLLGDALKMETLVEPNSIDMVMTSPPYGALLKKVKEAFGYKWQEHSKIAPIKNPPPYSEDPRDLGNLPYSEYLGAITNVMENTVKVMKDGAYAVWVVKDFRASKEKIPFVPFHMHIADCAVDAGLQLWDMQIWDQTKFRPLVCLGYPSKNFYHNIGHSYNMIFRKA